MEPEEARIMHTFRFPVQVVFGDGSLQEIRRFARSFGKHALLVTGSGPTSRLTAVETVSSLLRQEGVEVTHFPEVESDPGVDTVEKGVELARSKGCDFFIGLGGGSPMDAAKVIAARMNNEADVSTWEGTGQIPRRAKPIICIPTTAGTGSEVTCVAVITGGKRRQKMSIVSQNIYPVLAVIDPRLTHTMPPELTAATGMDALSHAVESYVAKRAWELTRPLALKAVQLIFSFLERACQDGEDAEARRQMSMASFLAGMSFTLSGLGLVHALAYALGSHFGMHHGTANAVLLPHVMRFNAPSCPELYRELAVAMNADVAGLPALQGAEKAAQAVQELLSSLPLPGNLSQAGLPENSVETLAAEAFLHTRFRSSNPRDTVLEDLTGVLRQAFRQG